MKHQNHFLICSILILIYYASPLCSQSKKEAKLNIRIQPTQHFKLSQAEFQKLKLEIQHNFRKKIAKLEENWINNEKLREKAANIWNMHQNPQWPINQQQFIPQFQQQVQTYMNDAGTDFWNKFTSLVHKNVQQDLYVSNKANEQLQEQINNGKDVLKGLTEYIKYLKSTEQFKTNNSYYINYKPPKFQQLPLNNKNNQTYNQNQVINMSNYNINQTQNNDLGKLIDKNKQKNNDDKKKSQEVLSEFKDFAGFNQRYQELFQKTPASLSEKQQQLQLFNKKFLGKYQQQSGKEESLKQTDSQLFDLANKQNENEKQNGPIIDEY